MSDRHQIKERRGYRKRRETDEHDRDNGMPNEGHVASQRRYHVLAVDHCLTFPEEPAAGQRTLYPLRNHPARNLYVKKSVKCAATSHGRYEIGKIGAP